MDRCATDGHENREAVVVGTFDNPHNDAPPVQVGYCVECEIVLDVLGGHFFTPSR